MSSRAAPLFLLLVALFGCRSEARERAKRAPSATSSSASVPANSPVPAEPVPAEPGPAEPRPSEPPSQAPNAAEGGLVEVTGDEFIARIRGSGLQATLVNAWASWCGPCRREMPMLLAMKPNLLPRGIGVELVSVDEPDSQPQAIAFLTEHGASLPSYVAARPLGPFKLALNPSWPGMLPATFLFDKTGKLRYFWGGPVYEQELLDVIDQFLAGTLVDGEARFGLMPGKVEH